MTDATQPKYDPEGLKVTESPNPYDQPELVQNSYQVSSDANKTGAYHERGTQGKLICGLNRQAFWFVIIVAVIVIIAAVGAGVGSSLAIQNAKSKSEINPTTTTQHTSKFEFSASLASSASTLSTLTTSPATNTKTTFVPPIATNIMDIGSRCPSDVVTSFDGRHHFKCYDAADFGDGIIAALIAYSVQDCVQACAATNSYLSDRGRAASCMGVTISKDLVNSININRGPNCWIKEESLGDFGNGKIDNTTSLRLCTNSLCEGM